MVMAEKLAIDGGPKAKTTPNFTMFPGGLEVGEEEKAQVIEALDRKYLFRYYGPAEYPSKVAEFENRFADRIGRKYALATNSCTSSLICALAALGIGPGDEVIIPGYTFIASCTAVAIANAVPIICDTDDTLTMDPKDIEKRITPLTRAIMPVHMRGVPCDMDAIMAIAKKHNLKIIEDTAQACGGTYKGKPLGSIGDLGSFSFQYHKIITCGEGGAVLTDNEILYDRCRSYHDSASCWRPIRFAEERYEGELFCGENYRMSEVSGAILLAQLNKLESLLFRMRRNQKIILDGIKEISKIQARRRHDDNGDVGVCVIFYLEENKLVQPFVEALKSEGVECSGIYNKGIPDWHIYAHWKHLLEKKAPAKYGGPWNHPIYKEKGGNAEYSTDMCPNVLRYLAKSVHIDVPPQMSIEDCEMIVKAIKKVANVKL